MAQEQIELVINNSSAMKALLELNNAITGTEKTSQNTSAALDKISQFIVQSTDKETKAVLRHVEALTKQAEQYSKTPIEKLTQQREREIKKIQESSLALEAQRKAIEAVGKAYDKMIQSEHGGGENRFAAYGESIKQFIESPMKSAQGAVGGFMETIGPLGGVLLGGATAIAAFGTAALESAKSLGEWAIHIKDVEMRTGFTAREVAQFGYAARLVGKDVDSFSGMMKGLTNAIYDNSEAGVKARGFLTKWGVDIEAAKTGAETMPDILLKVSRGFNTLASGTESAYAAQVLMKKIGIENIPLLKELAEGVERSQTATKGSSQDEIERYAELGKQAVDFEIKWEKAIRNVKGMVVDLAEAFKDVVDHFSPKEPGESVKISDHRQIEAYKHLGKPALQEQIDQLKEQMKSSQPTVWTGLLNAGASAALLTGTATLPSYDDLKKGFHNRPEYAKASTNLRFANEAMAQLDNPAHASLIPPEEDKSAQNMTQRLTLERDKLLADLLTGEQKLNAEYKAREDSLTKQEHTTKNIALLEQMRGIAIERYNKAGQYQVSNAAFEASRAVGSGQIKAGESIQAARDRIAGTDASPESINASKAATMAAADEEFQAAARNIQHLRDIKSDSYTIELAQIAAAKQYALTSIEAQKTATISLMDLEHKQNEERIKAADELLTHQQSIMDVSTRSNIQTSEGFNAHRRRMRDIVTGGRGSSLSSQIGRVSQDQSDNDSEAYSRFAALEDNLNKKKLQDQQELDSLVNASASDKELAQKKLNDLEKQHLEYVDDYNKQIAADRYSAEEKIAELQERQFEEIKSNTEGLLHTLFTNPKNFGKQFQSTVTDAALHPIEDRLSTMIAAPIQKMFGGGTAMKPIDRLYRDPLPVAVINMPGGGFSMAGGGGTFRSGGPSFAASSGAFSNLPPMFFNDGGGSAAVVPGDTGTAVSSMLQFDNSAPESLPTAYYPGSTGMFGGFGGTTGGGGNFLSGLFGSRSQASPVLQSSDGGKTWTMGGKQNLAPSFKNFKDNLGGLTRNADGSITGVNGMAGAGLFAGGSYLAQRGLLGKDRGTGLGIAEGAIGGAAIGFQQGGPIGGAIGAVVGLGIGVGEKMAGVESPQNQAKRLVKQRYGVTIDNSTTDAIVQIAQQKYGGNVGLAVSSPDVRQMLSLFSASTGQNMPLSATTPHAGSLSESGGKLFQDSTTMFGRSYSYASSLPVAGGMPTTQYPSNQPMSLSISVAGKGAGDFLAGSVVSPEFVQSQWSAAQQSSNGRVNNAATLLSPSLITG